MPKYKSTLAQITNPRRQKSHRVVPLNADQASVWISQIMLVLGYLATNPLEIGAGAQASMPTRHGGSFWKNASTWRRMIPGRRHQLRGPGKPRPKSSVSIVVIVWQWVAPLNRGSLNNPTSVALTWRWREANPTASRADSCTAAKTSSHDRRSGLIIPFLNGSTVVIGECRRITS